MELAEIVSQLNKTLFYKFDTDNIHVNMKGYKGTNLLIVAATTARLDIVNRLIQLGIEINDKDNSGNTALQYICRKRNVDDVFDILISSGADYNNTNKIGVTCLMRACEFSNNTIIEKLLQLGSKIDVKSQNGLTPLIAYMYNHENNIDILERLVFGSKNVISEIYLKKTAFQRYKLMRDNLILDDYYLSILKGESVISNVKSALNI